MLLPASQRAAWVILCSTVLLLSNTGSVAGQFPAVPDVTVANGFIAELWAPNLPNVRSLVYDGDAGVVLALVRGEDSIYSLQENKEGTAVTVTKLINNSTLKLNHGLALHKGYVYASSPSAVYRWPYKAGQPITSPPTKVVKAIPFVVPPGEETGRTRTLLFKGDTLYVAIGARLNVDPDRTRSKVVSFDLSQPIPDGGFDFATGQKLADGLRNTVGLAIDLQNRIWGAECGADRLVRADLGATLEQDNPAEELNLLEPAGGYYGFPDCFTAWNIANTSTPSSSQQLQQFIWPSVSPDFTQMHTDAWCRDPKNNVPPKSGMPGHSVPIGINFYDGKGCKNKGGFDCWMKGDLFVAMRGSFDKLVPNGYQVARMPFKDGNPTTLAPVSLIQHTDYQKNCVTDDQKAKCFRPTSVIFLPSGKMLIGVDIAKGFIVRLSRDGTKLTSDKGGDNAAVLPQASLWAALVALLCLLAL